jgi:hypothetical protein
MQANDGWLLWYKRGNTEGEAMEKARILELINAEIKRTSKGTFDAYGVLNKLVKKIEGIADGTPTE